MNGANSPLDLVPVPERLASADPHAVPVIKRFGCRLLTPRSADRSAPTRRHESSVRAHTEGPRLCSLTLTEELTTHGANRAVLAQFGVSDGPLLPDLTVC
ncbi:MAG: hypothetical protein QOH53_2628 [Ilumatobacteraceae bacterium]